MSSVEADFDRLATLDEQGWTTNNHYHDLLLKHVPLNCELALEIGCGTGAFARLLGEKCKRVVAVDLSSEMICAARQHSKEFRNIEFHQADVMAMDLQSSHFDFICAIATLHHLDQAGLLTRMKAALKPGGVLVVLDLVESTTWFEKVMDLFAVVASSGLRLLKNGQLQQPPSVRKAWEEHGKHDHYLSLSQVRKMANEIIPGAVVTRRFLWRYTLVYQKWTNLSLR